MSRQQYASISGLSYFCYDVCGGIRTVWNGVHADDVQSTVGIQMMLQPIVYAVLYSQSDDVIIVLLHTY